MSRKFYIVYEREDAPRKAHIASSNIPGTQKLLENKFTPAETTLECEYKPTTRYLLREEPGGADTHPNSGAWGNYVIDHEEEAIPYDTFEDAAAALSLQQEALNG